MAATCREIRVSTYLRFGAGAGAVFLEVAAVFYQARGGTVQFTPRISTCVFFELGFWVSFVVL
jgi:hypothetical protein